MSHLVDTGLANAAVIAAIAGGTWAVSRGLLVEPVDMRVLGECGSQCSRVRCTMENQGPLRASGVIVVDAWADGGYEDGTWRQEAPFDLARGARVELFLDFEGVPYRRGRTIVRCMPWYAAGRYKPARDATP